MILQKVTRSIQGAERDNTFFYTIVTGLGQKDIIYNAEQEQSGIVSFF